MRTTPNARSGRGWALIDAVGRLDVKSVKLQARVGIATGLVVVGDLIGEGSAQEQSVVGETPNLAARLQALAEPDAVVIAAGTRRLVGDLFEYRDLGAVEVKGIAGPVPAWRVLRPSVVASRFEALRGSALSPLVGRDEEIDLLLRRWARAKAGRRPGRTDLRRAWPRASRASSRSWRAAPGRAAYSPALFLLALSPGQRAFSVYRPARPGGGVRARRPACSQVREARGPAGPCRPAGRGCRHSSPICFHCRLRNATRCPNSVRSARRKGPWRR